MTCKSYLRILSLALALAVTAVPDAYSKKVTSKYKAPKATVSHAEKRGKVYPSDGERFTEVAGQLTFLGYDKKTTSAKESFLIDNKSDMDIEALELEITYLTPSGKQINKRTVNIKQLVPAGETRSVDIKSWDTQHSYHYVNSTASKSGSTPFTVRFKILSFTTTD